MWWDGGRSLLLLPLGSITHTSARLAQGFTAAYSLVKHRCPDPILIPILRSFICYGQLNRVFEPTLRGMQELLDVQGKKS
jgi:hypothetical protein